MNFDTAKTYEYDAFISYSHLDQKEAVAIQRKLERYWIPKSIRRERGNKSPRLKVFLDETDLSAGNLGKNIEQFLDISARLIVICSAVPALDGKDKYKWVTQEVQYFIDKGRSDDILPIILDGDWDAIPLNVKGMSDTHFIADVSELGRRTAFLKVLSAVLETDFDALVRRANTRRREKRGVLFAACLVIALLFHYYYMPHTAYYADYVMRSGLPEGIRKLSKSQRLARSDVFAVTIWRSKHEIRLEHTNSAGLPGEDTSPNHIEPFITAVYNCFDDWRINTVTYLDEGGKQLYTYVYAPDLSYIDLVKSKDDARWLTSDAGWNEYNLPVRTNISRYNLEFDADGRMSRRMYVVDRMNAVNEKGVGGESYVYDTSGRISEINYLDVNGKPMTDKHGIAEIHFYYDDLGRNYRMEYYGTDGTLINNEDWYAVVEKGYDDYDNESEIYYRNAENVLTITAGGYAVIKKEYDQNGFLAYVSYYGTDNEAVFNQNGFHRVAYQRDDMGRDTEDSFWDTKGNLVRVSEKYAKRINTYSDKGLIQEQLYYNENGEPCLCAIGAYQAKCEYDEQGNMTKISYYDVDGELAYTTLGYAVMLLEYNDMGMETGQSYFGVHNEPILGKEGYHKQEFLYDQRYNIERIQYTGTSGQSVLCDSGYAARVLEYDNAGNILKDSYFDDYDVPTYRIGYYATAVMGYDEHGNRTSIELLATDGSPIDNGVYSKQEFFYDEIGRIKEEHFYKEDDLSVKHIYQYTDNGLISSETVLTSDDTIISQAIYEYDEKGNESEVITIQGDTVTGKTAREFDERGQVIKESYFDSEDRLLQYYTVEFNNNGMPVKTSYFGSDRRLSRDANSKQQVAVVEADYDDQNREIERRCYDENGKPLRIFENGRSTYARLEVRYGKHSTESIFYDETGTVYQSIMQEYDEYDHETDRIYYDGNHGQLVRHTFSYNERGMLTSDALYNGRDELQADESSGVAKILYFYDDYDYMVGEEFYDENDKLIAPYGLYPKYTAVRKDGRTVEIKYYGTDGKLALNPDGYAIEKFTYDERGNENGRSFYDVDGNPVLLKWRFSRYEVTYDETGNIKDSKFFDTAGREVTQVDGKIQKTEVLLDNIPRKILMFYGNDGSELMGQVEMKLKVPLKEKVQSSSVTNSDDDFDIQSQTWSVGEATEKVEQQTDSDTEYKIASDVEEKNSAEENKFDFSGREYIHAVDDYVRAIENFDGIEMVDALDQQSFIAMLTAVGAQQGVAFSENKLYHIYVSFYDKELDSLKEELERKYGADLYVTYQIVAEEYEMDDMILEINNALKELGIDDYKIQEIVTLNLTYTVSGSESQGIEDTGFFIQPLILLKVDDEWRVVPQGDLPQPSMSDIQKAR